MKKIYILSILLLVLQFDAAAQSIFELRPSQSMSITGKGQGQDAAINPYSNENSVGIIENIGENSFVIRVQNAGVVIKMISINPMETKEVSLFQGYELYLDSDLQARAKVTFKKSGS
jgi:hypothetical protein